MTTPAQAAVEPNWIAVIVASVALVVSVIAAWLTRRNKRSEIEQAFVHQRNEINLAFAEYQVKGPFAHLLGVKDEELETFIPKVCLLFLQLNLLNDVAHV